MITNSLSRTGFATRVQTEMLDVLQALRLFPAVVIVPTMQISWTLFSVVSGGIYYQEYHAFTAFTASMFGLGVLVQSSPFLLPKLLSCFVKGVHSVDAMMLRDLLLPAHDHESTCFTNMVNASGFIRCCHYSCKMNQVPEHTCLNSAHFAHSDHLCGSVPAGRACWP